MTEIYYNLSLNSQRHSKFIIIRDSLHEKICGLLRINSLLMINDELCSYKTGQKIIFENMLSRLFNKRDVIKKRDAIQKLNLNRLQLKYLSHTRSIYLHVIFHWKRVCAYIKRLKYLVITKFRQIRNRKYKKYNTTKYAIKKVIEDPNTNIHTIHRISFLNNDMQIESVSRGYWSEYYDSQLSSNYDMLYKMNSLGFLKCTDIYSLSNLASKRPEIFVKQSNKWVRLILIRHRKTLSGRDYALFIKWRDKLNNNTEYTKIKKARRPLSPYWSKLSSKILVTLRKMDTLHLDDSDLSMWFSRVCWSTYEFCYIIMRRVLYIDNDSGFVD
jgi:hypothetical protein